MLESPLSQNDFDMVTRKDVFVINDIALVVPPTAISVQKEDLTYTWRTLRTRSSTKIPTGHGNINISVSLIFTNDRMIDLHRLVVQLRASPFCYVENRYLRETIIPELNMSQAMAFCMDAMQISPLPGASDAWVAQLSLTWFNYYPYSPNFLFREEWETEWLEGPGGGETESVRHSIGWKWEGGKRKFTPCVTARQKNGGAQVKEWSLQQEGYKNKSNRTLFDMEALHLGQEFDMLPLPGNMASSKFAFDPRNSRIYVRYINLLQRDALMDNFGIDIEGLLVAAGLPREGFFGVWEEPDGSKQTWGLHSGPTNTGADARGPWFGVMRQVTNEMLKANGRVSFAFQTYQQVDIPNEWGKALSSLAAVVRKDYQSTLESNPLYAGDWIELKQYDASGSAKPWHRRPKRTGFSHPEGFRSPVGQDGNRFTIGELRNMVSSRVTTRSPSKTGTLHGETVQDGSGYDRVHWGTDFGAGGVVGRDVYACRPGKVQRISYGSEDATKVVWKYYNAFNGEIGVVADDAGGLYKDWLATMTAALGKDAALKTSAQVGLDGNAVNLKTYQGFGSIIRDAQYDSIFYYTDIQDGGNYVVVNHGGADAESTGGFDGDISVYMHLKRIDVKVGDQIVVSETGVTAPGEHNIDLPLGELGQTSTLNPDYVKWFVNYQGGSTGGSGMTQGNTFVTGRFQTLRPFNHDLLVTELQNKNGGFTLPLHLHFEYWEREGNGNAIDKSSGSGTPKNFDNSRIVGNGWVVVDPVASFEHADDPTSSILKVNPPVDAVDKISAEVVAKKIKDDNGKSYDVDMKKVEEAIEIMETLSADGWYHYEGAMKLPNVWYKTWVLNYVTGDASLLKDPGVNQYGLQPTPDLNFEGLNTVVTGLSGGFTNIVARIPILSHEYPTLQHMGSIEPSYSFEFTCLDDYVTLEGISDGGKLIEGMRSTLQRNARKYREIKDSWALVTDSFITRLLGSYRVHDAEFTNEGPGVLNQLTLLKRTIIERADNGTVEGNPGLSFVGLEMSETNPYDEEAFVNINPPFLDVEAARRDVLKALYALDITEEYRDSVLPVLIGSLANKSIFDPNSTEGYGRFSLENIGSASAYAATIGGIAFAPGGESGGSIIISDPTGVYERLLRDQLQDEFDTKGISSSHGSLSIPYANSGLSNTGTEYGESGGGALLTGPAASYADTAWDNATSTVGASTVGLVTVGLAQPWEHSARSAGLLTEAPTVLRTSFDISSIIESSPDISLLTKLDLPKIADYWQMVDAIVKTANITLAEEQTLVDPAYNAFYEEGGLPEKQIQDELYGLPVVPQMWRLWQKFQAQAAKLSATLVDDEGDLLAFYDYSDPNTSAAFVTATLVGNKGWLEWNKTDADLSADLLATASKVETGLLHSGESISDVTSSITESAADGIGLILGGAKNIMLHPLTNVDVNIQMVKDQLAERTSEGVADAEATVVETYILQMFPSASESFKEMAKSYSKDSLFEPFVRLIGGEAGNVDGPLQSVSAALKRNMHSCGFWSFGWDQGLKSSAFNISTDQVTWGSSRPAFVIEATRVKTADDGTQFLSTDTSRLTRLQATEWYNVPFDWMVETDVEKSKVHEFKRGLARLADDILMSPKMLAAFGLEKYANILASQKTLRGTECYPDLQLPEHPYYGDTRDVAPDFYFWNMYDDGQAFHPEVIARIRASADHIVSNCYDSMAVMQGRNDKANEMPYMNTSVNDQQIITPLRYNAEGTDGNSANPSNQGHTAIPWYEDDASKDAVAKFEGTLSAEKEKSIKAAGTVSPLPVGSLTVDVEQITRTNPLVSSLSVTDGPGGAKAGIHYPARAPTEIYAKLQARLDDSRAMFGSKEGYQKQQFDTGAPAPIVAATAGSALQKPLAYTHLFDKGSLKQLAFDATRDIISQKMTMRRAFPTFKLFFIEEDELEDHLIAYDDFHSYNGVKEFTVVQSRKIAADVAIISIQNVSGTLDGTRRDAITDVDYFSSKVKTKGANDSKVSGDAIAEGTDAEQPFEAVLLRPGMNVQLRSGYANDPRNLHVLISGRVVDITWNKSGDMAEIMVQGFGAELVQALKGTEGSSAPTYYTTHHLLGAMMLQPELMHFGRWERGQLFQDEEAQDSRLDFYDYSREGFLGRWSITTSVTSWLTQHPFLFFLGAAGLGYFSLLGGASGGAKTVISGAGKSGWFLSLFKGASRVGTLGGSASRGLEGAGALARVSTSAGVRPLITEAAGGAAAIQAAGGFTRIGTSVLSGVDDVVLRHLTQVMRTVSQGSGGTWTFASRRLARAAIVEARIGVQGAQTVEQAAGAVASATRTIVGIGNKGIILNNPAATLFSSPLSWFGQGSVKRVLGASFRTYTTGQSKLLLGAILTTTALDLIRANALVPLYDATVGRLQRWFDTSRVSLFISPQDDNLFCPHPKDYMDIKPKSVLEEVKTYAAAQAAAVISVGGVDGYSVLRWWRLESVFDKRVPPQACQYQIENMTIWDLFHEMSLRHPGWVYGVRPYGHAFRNTMFFGIPSQRYWAKPASNEFIQRANMLSKFLANNEISEDEYKQLYGNDISGQTFEEYKESLSQEVAADSLSSTFASSQVTSSLVLASTSGQTTQSNDPFFSGKTVPIPGQGSFVPKAYEQQPPDWQQTGATDNLVVDSRFRAALTAPAIQEYLRGLELRFVPFRNHHMISSTRDLVWNGIMSSENATYNAVAVTYFNEEDGHSDVEPGGTETFKAHSFIPEHMIRVLSLPVYRNCISYPMAVRYAMGTLMDTMKDMYRGEIIVTGNPRLRPWDIAILTDDYNDMVGPIEIEQVVHTFSHETGFITEIKPSAIVIGNEISSWPLIEAAKLWTLAVRDIETKYWHGGSNTGAPGDILEFLTRNLSAADTATLTAKYRAYYGNELPFIQDLNSDKELMGSLMAWDDDIAGVVDTAQGVSVGVIGAAGVAAILVGGAAALKVPGIAGKVLTGGAALGFLGAGVTAGALAWGLQAPPSLKMLIGGTVLFAQMAREESIILVPLMKNGMPIVSGLNIQDPSMMWTHFRGNLRRAVSDTFEGTEDLMRLWGAYGSGSWETVMQAWDDSGNMDPNTRVVNTDLTEN